MDLLKELLVPKDLWSTGFLIHLVAVTGLFVASWLTDDEKAMQESAKMDLAKAA